MSLKVVHLIDEFSQSNHGIIEAAVATSHVLADRGVHSEVWFPENSSNHTIDFRAAIPVAIAKSQLMDVRKHLTRCATAPADIVIVSHGAWRYPTRLAYQLQSAGCRWIYTPHGMLEPWSMRQKWIQKKLYWRFVEHKYVNRADIVRATSVPEHKNLSRIFRSAQLLPHGVNIPQQSVVRKNSKKRVLFLGRLHHKKSPVALVEAWLSSALNGNNDFELVIVGNDEGELVKLHAILDRTPANIQLRPPVYGNEKTQLFSECTFFALPSHSEGFPVALLEAMASGLVPLISDGCNLPDAFNEGVAIRLTPFKPEIELALNEIARFPDEKIAALSQNAQQFVKDRYSIESMAERQFELFNALQNRSRKEPSR